MGMQTKIIIKRLSELPTAPTTIGTMAWNQTGDWRYVTPLVADKMAPCSQNCPAGIPIPRHLGAMNRGDIEGGLALLLAYNPLPGLTGRLCYHPCQTKCVRRKIDRAISIQKVERFLGDLAMDVTIEKSDKTDQRVTVIGSGPLGLSCAFYLGCRGYRVVVLDPSNQAGGALGALSPEKIEPQVLSHEIDRLIRLADIRLETGALIDFAKLDERSAKADLVILDPTGLPEDFCAPAGAVPCNPFEAGTVIGSVVSVQLPQNLAPFKAPMIAHYIAAGRLLARKVSDGLRKGGREEFSPDLPPQAVSIENIKIERFQASGPPAETETSQAGTWDRERAMQEAERCLSCGTCNLCLQCVSYCPDASIRPDGEKTCVAVDLDHCKGCGICAYECPRGVITMEDMSV
jgi:Pyruvate/2-oxoacid:ferredoxin oxidoreductase delta subunit